MTADLVGSLRDALRCDEQAAVLERAAEASPLPTIAGKLAGMALEYRLAALGVQQALEEGEIPFDHIEVAPRATVEKGCRLWVYNIGRARVLRITGTGVEVEPLDDLEGRGPTWLNAAYSQTPLVFIK